MNQNYKTRKFYLCKYCDEQNAKFRYMKDLKDHFRDKHIFKVEKLYYLSGFVYIRFYKLSEAIKHAQKFLLIIKYEER